MEFRIHAQQEEKVYNPTPLQQSALAFPMPLPSLPLHFAAPAEARPAACGVARGGGSRPHFNSAASPVSADEVDAPAALPLRYGECLRNHAASHGGHVLDGCGEFMPFGDDGLKCAACGCHRSFHRKDVDGDLNSEVCDHIRTSPYLLPLPNCLRPPPTPSPHALGLQPYGSRGVLLRTGNSNGASAGEAATELSSGPPLPEPQQFLASRKRFRSKFTAEQKDKMMRFAEKAGWRMQKLDETAVAQFCGEVGVTRQVFKVWMHNNKNSMMRKQPQEKGEEEEEEDQEEEEEEEEVHELPPPENHKVLED